MIYEPIQGVCVIGIGHKARHGKDSFARAVINRFEGAQRFAFADDLYAMCRIAHGMTTKDSPLLQRVGVEWRERDPDVWIRAVYTKLLETKPKMALVTDLRFPNEIAFIKALGGITIRVTRYNPDGTAYVDPSRSPDHISETALSLTEWDMEVENRGLSKLALDAQRIAMRILVDHALAKTQAAIA